MVWCACVCLLCVLTEITATLQPTFTSLPHIYPHRSIPRHPASDVLGNEEAAAKGETGAARRDGGDGTGWTAGRSRRRRR
uniref:Putative secreted protein n=1 Tax=Anopheles darlingi TaxID=43151 RepID=A0A2M4DNU1_ANODA